MKKTGIIVLSAGTALMIGAGLVLHKWNRQPQETPANLAGDPVLISEPAIEEKESPPIVVKTEVASVVEAVEIPIEEPEVAAQPAPTPTPQPQPLTREEQMRAAQERYYTQMARNFNRLLGQFNGEQDPVKRQRLIDALARYVRVDTLAALDWAATIEDPEEKRAALEAINKNALTGIGAHIEMDAIGLPKIRDTTILSAVESSGKVESGDYISGVMNPDGSIVYFHGLSIQEIVKHLRGAPGTEIKLMMERLSQNGGFTSFDVPIQRSLIVIQPPL
jgi:C-terminal processing protease CtpA/Prc